MDARIVVPNLLRHSNKRLVSHRARTHTCRAAILTLLLAGNCLAQNIPFADGQRPSATSQLQSEADASRSNAEANRLNADANRLNAEANKVNAQAWSEAEQAYTSHLDNSLYHDQIHWMRRELNSQKRFGDLHALAAERKRASKTYYGSISSSGGADFGGQPLLSPGELDPGTGELKWPLLLRSAYYSRARQPVDHVFAMRAKNGEINPDHYLPLLDWIERIEAELQKHVESLPKQDVVVSKNFLRRLAGEVRLPHRTISPDARLARN